MRLTPPLAIAAFLLAACRETPPPLQPVLPSLDAGPTVENAENAPAGAAIDVGVPTEADPTLVVFNWKANAANGSIEWSQRLLRPGECAVTVREPASGKLRWVAPGCIAKRTQRVVPAPDGERVFILDPAPVLDEVEPTRTILVELRQRTELVRRWRALVLPDGGGAWVEGNRLAWVASRANTIALGVDAAGMQVERPDGVVMPFEFAAAPAEDVLPAPPRPPGCETGPCRFTDVSGNVHVVGTPEEVPARYRDVARAVTAALAVERSPDDSGAAAGADDAPAGPAYDGPRLQRTPDPSTRPAAPEAGGEADDGREAVEPAAEAPAPDAPGEAAPPAPNHFDRVRSMLGMPTVPADAPPPPSPDARCELVTDPMTGVTKTVCR